ncbi:MAG: peptide deformylase [Candidatus Limnocylindrales bacterium]
MADKPMADKPMADSRLPAVRPIVVAPAPVLRAPARPVRLPDPGVSRLVDELFATMRANAGLGLAAPQLGDSLRVAVVEAEGRQFVLVNPTLVAARGNVPGWEGCLSVPYLVGWLGRPAEVVVTGLDLAGHRVRWRARGLAARAIAHELDHLEGRLYLDRIAPAGRPQDLVDTREHPTPPARRT